ncbi:hypothetical protein OXX79_014159, partial [Metschnikowia pulcherrima]
NDTLKVNSLTAKISLPMKHPEAISLAQFTIVLRSLTVNVSKLDNSAAGALVAAIVRYPWLEIPSAAKKAAISPRSWTFTHSFSTCLFRHTQNTSMIASRNS